jgi:hypothetical protein
MRQLLNLVKQNIFTLLLLGSIAILLCLAVFGVGRNGGNGLDFSVMYAGGRAWLTGVNPYNQNELNQVMAGIKGLPKGALDSPFSYPPPTAAFFVPLALFSFPIANVFWILLNLLSVAAIVTLSIYVLNQHTKGREYKVRNGIIAAFIIANPLTTNVVWQGQTSLVVFAATMGAWFFSRQNKWILAGICLGVATCKPQLCILVFVWFLLERSWKIIGISLITAGVMSIYLLIVQGPIGVMTAWLLKLQAHKDFYANVPGFEHVIGLQSLFWSAGLKIPNLEVVGIASVTILWSFRSRINPEDIFAILMALTLLFVFLHDSEYVCLIPVFTSLWMYWYDHRKYWPRLILLLVLFIFPRRVVRTLEIPVLNQWRIVIVLIMFALVVRLSIKYKSQLDLQKISA